MTIDRAAIQRAVDAARPGDAVYFPAGSYPLDDSIKVLISNLTIYGDGPTSVLMHFRRRGFDLGIFSEPLTGLVVRRMKFQGMPGLYKADGNGGSAIQIVGPTNTLISDCDFRGSGYAVYNAGKTYGTRIENCRVDGWGECVVFCNGGEQITNCRFIQDDPDRDGERSSHGLYIHSGAHDILVQDTLIRGARKFATQLYGEERGTTIERVSFRRVTFEDCKYGLTIQQGWETAARAKQVTIEDCTFRGIYKAPALEILGGDGLQIRDNLIENCPMAGIALGRFTSWYAGWGSVTDTVASGNVIRNCGIGIWAAATNGGRFSNVSLDRNRVTNCRQPYNLKDTPGVLLRDDTRSLDMPAPLGRPRGTSAPRH